MHFQRQTPQNVLKIAVHLLVEAVLAVCFAALAIPAIRNSEDIRPLVLTLLPQPIWVLIAVAISWGRWLLAAISTVLGTWLAGHTVWYAYIFGLPPLVKRPYSQRARVLGVIFFVNSSSKTASKAQLIAISLVAPLVVLLGTAGATLGFFGAANQSEFTVAIPLCFLVAVLYGMALLRMTSTFVAASHPGLPIANVLRRPRELERASRRHAWQAEFGTLELDELRSRIRNNSGLPAEFPGLCHGFKAVMLFIDGKDQEYLHHVRSVFEKYRFQLEVDSDWYDSLVDYPFAEYMFGNDHAAAEEGIALVKRLLPDDPQSSAFAARARANGNFEEAKRYARESLKTNEVSDGIFDEAFASRVRQLFDL